VSKGSTHHTLQAVWNRAAPGDTCPPRGDFTTVVLVFLILWAWSTRLMVMLQRWDCWCSLSCGSERIPWVVARDRG